MTGPVVLQVSRQQKPACNLMIGNALSVVTGPFAWAIAKEYNYVR